MAAEKLAPGDLPAAIRDLAGRIAAAGGRTWLVGGTVRDRLLGLVGSDYDLATDLPPDRLVPLFPGAELRDVRYGSLRLPTEGLTAAITVLRQEGDYQDHRRPGAVRFLSDPRLDAGRRDFTVNALYLDLATGELLDPCGGLPDLRARRLRTIGPPAQRFREDPLRLLRLLRFLARLQFEPEAATAAAAKASAPELRHLSAERSFEELTRAFTGPGRGRALRLLVDLGFAAELLPEVAALAGVTQPPEYHPEGDVLTHCCLVLEEVPAGDPVLAWTAVLHDVGKPPTWRLAEDRIRFDGHDVLSATMAEAVLDRLHAPGELRAAVADLCRQHIRFASLPQMRPRRREVWLRQPDFGRHLAFHRADCLGSHRDLSRYETVAAALRALPPERPQLCGGADVLALGVPEGPMVGELLRAVEARLDEAEEPTRELALATLRLLVDDAIKAGRLPVDTSAGD